MRTYTKLGNVGPVIFFALDDDEHWSRDIWLGASIGNTTTIVFVEDADEELVPASMTEVEGKAIHLELMPDGELTRVTLR